MRKNHIICAGIVLFLFWMAGAVPDMKNGFVTYSEGDGGDRALMYRKITDGKMGEPVSIVKKGEAGGDIEGNISFDGKWIAFARKKEAKCPKQGGQWNGNGEDDYHKFHCVGIFIARLDGDLPTEPIKIIDEGYWPSWGDDSFGPTKTLYFGVWTKGEVWKTTVTDADNKFTAPVKHATVEGWKEGDHHMQTSPNGKYVAVRGIGKGVIVLGLNDTKHNQSIGGGCHPSWMADSKHLYHAKSWVGNINGEKVGSAANYHFGSSSNMKWAITLSSGVTSNQQNHGYPIKYAAVEYNTTDSVVTKIGPYDSEEVTAKGNFPDIHDFDGLPVVRLKDKLPAPANLKIELSDGQVVVNTPFSGMQTIELFDINGAQKANTVKSHSSRTAIPVQHLPEGIYFIRVNSKGKSLQKKLMVM